jgi:hypothetical protein
VETSDMSLGGGVKVWALRLVLLSRRDADKAGQSGCQPSATLSGLISNDDISRPAKEDHLSCWALLLALMRDSEPARPKPEGSLSAGVIEVPLADAHHVRFGPGLL